MLILRHEKNDEEHFDPYPDYQDVTTADLRTTVDYLRIYGSNRAPGPKDCKGVLIRCEGDIKLNRQATGKWEVGEILRSSSKSE